MSNYKEMQDIKAELMNYVELQNDEFTEACTLMCEFHHRLEYIGNEKLTQLIEDEIKLKLKYFKDNYNIVETTETSTYTFKELVENDE